MTRSAALFLVGEFSFYRAGVIRTPRTAGRDEAIFRRWLEADVDPKQLSVSPLGADGQRAVLAFVRTLRSFDEILTQTGRRHLLLVQPDQSLRDPRVLGDPERALFNYYMSLHNLAVNAFAKATHAETNRQFQGDPNVRSMDSLHQAAEWTLVDHCHFTVAANRHIAEEIAEFILSGGRTTPFASRSAQVRSDDSAPNRSASREILVPPPISD
jgi:hypothetical protein